MEALIPFMETRTRASGVRIARGKKTALLMGQGGVITILDSDDPCGLDKVADRACASVGGGLVGKSCLDSKS